MVERLSVGNKLQAKFTDGGTYPAEVVAISSSSKRAKAPVKVRYTGYGAEDDAWLAVADLVSKKLSKDAGEANPVSKHAPSVNLSLLEAGVKLQARATDDVWYSAEVVSVSKANQNSKSPVKVHYAGYTSASDEWVGVDRLRSKLLSELPKAKLSEAARTAAAAVKDALHAHVECHVAGVALAVIKDGKVKLLEREGLRRVETKWPIKIDSVFQVASVSKTVTGTCAMQLVERGKLELDSDINLVLKKRCRFEVRNPGHPEVPITLRMLMSHCSSVTDSDVYDESYTAGDSQWSLKSFLREYFSPEGSLYDAEANFLNDENNKEDEDYKGSAPGQTHEYSNIGAGLVGLLVEAASGLPFEKYAEKHVFEPLGMSSSSFTWAGLDQLGVSRERVAMPYSWSGTTNSFKPHGFYGCPTIADGFLRTTILDLSAFLSAYMAGGTHPVSGVKLLSAESVKEMHRPHFPEATEGYGLMWSLDDCNRKGVGLEVEITKGDDDNSKRPLIGHGGGDPGVATGMFFDPLSRAGVIILRNGDLKDASEEDEAAHTASDEALWKVAWAFADEV